MVDSTVSILNSLNFNFSVDENSSTKEFAVLRTTFQNAKEVRSFVEEIQKVTHTNYRKQLVKYKLKRLLFRNRWICQHSSHRKVSGSKKDAKCTSFIDVTIKRITKGSKRGDAFLALKEPLPCVIKMNLKHTHSTESADALRRLDVMPETKKEFDEYFKNGLTPCEARRLHEDKLIAQYGSGIRTDRQIYYMYDKWRNENFGPVCDPFSIRKEKMSDCKSEGCTENFTETMDESVIDSEHLKPNEMPSESGMNQMIINESEFATEKEKTALKLQIEKLLSFNLKKSFVNRLSRNMQTYLKSVHTDCAVDKKILKMSAIFSIRRQRKITVQPMSINRLRKNITKKNAVIPAGSPYILKIQAKR